MAVKIMVEKIKKGDYYYNARIPAYKKFIAAKVTKKIISQFD